MNLTEDDSSESSIKLQYYPICSLRTQEDIKGFSIKTNQKRKPPQMQTHGAFS